ncbi:MAG: tripartite tricarboxylate transporter substrate binding protein [Pigmentiphaga sp.]|uniref:Bug family tripartite tricarboxylate transporter substrate binding protein n=1 Tax=Pigmentiphaga sp. TaxID=1977564 RepID=UPI0029B75A54|nr:tripartite tricarboxylate transporter substrate binding protein [Pigmentiphaga sp.]MDX3907309.1 tripartite tricarboxylate transporter substrate binding protein [Pigmentiphaga sp.]
MNRTLCMKALIGAAGACLAWPAAQAGDFPDRPVHFIVPFAPGGTADVLTRALSQKLGQRLGQPVIVENRPGASTAIGVKHAAAAAPDGYTILYGGVSSQVMNPLINRVDFDPVRDFTPISLVNSLPLVLVVHPSLPASDFAQFVALAQSRPKPITYASAGAGTSNHLAGELLKSAARIPLLHVPYKSSAPALNDLLGGHVDAMFDLVLTSAPQAKLGKVRPLAITSAQRSPLLPDVPTLRELGMPEGEVDVWTGVFGPAGMPRAVVERLNREIVSILQLPEVQQQFASLGAMAAPSTPAELGALLEAELAKWKRVVREARIGAD